tara:strand:- start:161 stop:379 length:219 start_codon:yes stop_codon:yes gene_type:complete
MYGGGDGGAKGGEGDSFVRVILRVRTQDRTQSPNPAVDLSWANVESNPIILARPIKTLSHSGVHSGLSGGGN